MTSILILEDNQDLCTLYSRSLIPAGYAVQFAGTLAEARGWLLEQLFDVFLCDMQVGDERGLDLLREQQSLLIGSHTITIVISAQEKYRRMCEALGVEFFISKPIDLQALMNLLQRLVHQS